MKVVKKIFLIICLLLICLPYPNQAFAKTNSTNFVGWFNNYSYSGIYTSVPNGKSKLLIKSKDHTGKLTSISPTNLELDDVNRYEVYEKNTGEISEIQTVGKGIYFSKSMFQGLYFDKRYNRYLRGGIEVYQIFRLNSLGKINKVTNDLVSDLNYQHFFISGSNIYYAKIDNKAYSKFSILKSSLDGKKKTILNSGVDDFWVKNGLIYFIKNGKLNSMTFSGEKIKIFSNIKGNFHNDLDSNYKNYIVANSGIKLPDYPNIFYSFSNKSFDKFTWGNWMQFKDADIKKNRIIGLNWFAELTIYDAKGKIIRTFKNVHPDKILSTDYQKRVIIYVEKSSLKSIKF